MDIEKILNEFFTNFNDLETISSKKHSELSKVDIELSNFYHEIEGERFTHNTQAHKYMIRLQDILLRRRELKKETILIRTFIDNTKSSIALAKQRTDSAVEKHNKVMLQINSKKST